MQTIRTPEKRELFLSGLKDFHGNVSKALEAANLSRSAAYDWKKEDQDFSTAWDDIVEAGTEELEQEAWRRAHEGWLEPVFYQGEEVGHVRKFSDVLMMFTLKGRKPEKYRDNSKVELGSNGPIQVNVVYDPPKP
jgi:hypothetical protein